MGSHRRHRAARALPSCGILAWAVLTACGPSVQVLHEGTVRFEHCHRLDLDSRIAPSHRRACWEAWVSRHSYGQPRDRIEYAQRRIVSIERGEPGPALKLETTTERAPSAEPDGPTDAHAPPPRVARPVEEAREVAGATASEGDVDLSAPNGLTAPNEACAQRCRREFGTCLETCPTGAPAACPCEATYRTCMVTCFD